MNSFGSALAELATPTTNLEKPCECALDIRGLTVSYGATSVLLSVDFCVLPRTMSVIVGPNGAGKSTLIKAALNVVRRLSGEILVFGQPLKAHRKRVAYVPQRASVDWEFPATVFDVVAMGQYEQLGLLGRRTALQHQHIEDCLERVGMAEFANRQIGQLSGGQQQRVFVARALVQSPDLYILDEPFAGVDAATERILVAVLHSLRNAGKTVLCVHHDLATVPDYFSHVLLLNVVCIASGPIAEVFTPENLQQAYGGRLAFAQLQRCTEHSSSPSASQEP